MPIYFFSIDYLLLLLHVQAVQ